MSTNIIAIYAVGVFVLMGIGIVLTMFEFNKLIAEAATDKKQSNRETAATGKANIRVVDSSETAA